MSVGKRVFWAIIAAGWSYFLYIYAANWIFDYIGKPTTTFGPATLELGDLVLLRYYIQFFGWCVVGLAFAKYMAHKKTAMRQIWNLLKIFAGIVFWSLFIQAGFDNFLVTAPLPQVDIAINISITILFYGMMGGKIFQMIIAVLSFFISFINEEEDDFDSSKKEKKSKKEEMEPSAGYGGDSFLNAPYKDI